VIYGAIDVAALVAAWCQISVTRPTKSWATSWMTCGSHRHLARTRAPFIRRLPWRRMRAAKLIPACGRVRPWVAGLPPCLARVRHRPSAWAVLHTRSTYSVAVSCMRDTNADYAIPPLTAYYAMRVGKLPLPSYHVPGGCCWPTTARSSPPQTREPSPSSAAPPDFTGQRRRGWPN